jgi:tRNA dimethylallyltransferase
MEKVLIIAGPTASGKSDIALEVCKRCGGEIVSADSMQIYRGMDIGTAKPGQDDMTSVSHHMIDICNPSEEYSVAQYCVCAKTAINDILSRGRLPVVTGGTGLYIDSLVLGITYRKEREDIRSIYEEFLEINGKEALYELLKKRDEAAAASTHMNNTKRVIRYLEILEKYDGTLADYKKEALQLQPEYDYRMIILDPDREYLYERVNKRVDLMLKEGLVDEVKALLDDKDIKDSNAMQAIGYKEVIGYLNGLMTYDEMAELIKKNTRNYAKRQVTWFKRYKNAVFINITDKTEKSSILETVMNSII